MPKHRLLAALSFTLALAFVSQASLAKADEPWPEELTNWVKVDEKPVFEGAGGDAWDQKIRERGWILYDSDKKEYVLWYTGYNESKTKTRFLGRATSKDGLQWTRDPKNPIFDKGWVEDVCVVKRDKKYYMFAEGEKDNAHQLISDDGISWTELGKLDVRTETGAPISSGPYGTPAAWFENNEWKLLYERMDRGVWLAASKDRKVWRDLSDDPVIFLGPDDYDRAAIAVNQVIERDGYHYAFYHANAIPRGKTWTTCLARSRDLLHWEKCPKNPILDFDASSAVLVEGPNGKRLYTMHPKVFAYENPKKK